MPKHIQELSKVYSEDEGKWTISHFKKNSDVLQTNELVVGNLENVWETEFQQFYVLVFEYLSFVIGFALFVFFLSFRQSWCVE